MNKIKLGISSCLLGEKVRYDGGHKLDHYLKYTLGEFVEWVAVCPEVESGFSVPREAMHLGGAAESPRLVTRLRRTDHTEKLLRWSDKKLQELARENLCGFFFKSKSPNCGLGGVKVYGDSGIQSRAGTGIFARAFMAHFPLMPVEDDIRLHDPDIRENFIGRIFVFKRLEEFRQKSIRIKDLVEFHTRHKLLILSHSTGHYRLLGKIVANAERRHGEILHAQYRDKLMEGLKLLATAKKNTNVLMHCMGYFKRMISPDEKKELLEVIQMYHDRLIPLIVPVTLINHYVLKYDEQYLKRQYYLNPHPVELMLRNHA